MSGVVRSTQEAMHRAGESVQQTAHDAKRSVVGGSGIGDKASEAATHVSNRASEVTNRASDSAAGRP